MGRYAGIFFQFQPRIRTLTQSLVQNRKLSPCRFYYSIHLRTVVIVKNHGNCRQFRGWVNRRARVFLLKTRYTRIFPLKTRVTDRLGSRELGTTGIRSLYAFLQSELFKISRISGDTRDVKCYNKLQASNRSDTVFNLAIVKLHWRTQDFHEVAGRVTGV